MIADSNGHTAAELRAAFPLPPGIELPTRGHPRKDHGDVVDLTQLADLPEHLARFLDCFDEVHREHRSYLVRCPAHDDNNPSLLVSLTSDGAILMVCRSRRCPTHEILERIGLAFPDLYERATGVLVPACDFTPEI